MILSREWFGNWDERAGQSSQRGSRVIWQREEWENSASSWDRKSLECLFGWLFWSSVILTFLVVRISLLGYHFNSCFPPHPILNMQLLINWQGVGMEIFFKINFCHSSKVYQEIDISGNSLAVQWLGLGAFTAEGLVSVPCWGTKTPWEAAWHGQNKKQKKIHIISFWWFFFFCKQE